MTKSVIERYRPEPNALRYEVAPREFRYDAITEMTDHLDWHWLLDATVVSYTGRVPPKKVTAWRRRGGLEVRNPEAREYATDELSPPKRDLGPLLRCVWWRFMSVIELITRAQLYTIPKQDEVIRDSKETEPRPDRLTEIQDATEKAAKFEREINGLFRVYRLGYELRNGDVIEKDLVAVANLRHTARELESEADDAADLDAAWKSLQTLPHPNYKEVVRNVRPAIERVQGEYERLLTPSRMRSPAKEIAKGLLKVIQGASNLGPHDDSAEPTRADAIGIVGVAYALTAHLNAEKRRSTEPTAGPG